MVSERSESERDANQRGAKQIGTLRDSAANGDSAGASSLPRKMGGEVYLCSTGIPRRR